MQSRRLFADGRSDSDGSFIARPTDGADHDRLFALVERYASNFNSYAANTNGIRTIPVLRMTRKLINPPSPRLSARFD